jgi:hypothetical protein
MTKIIGRRRWITGFAVPIVTLLLAGCAVNGGRAASPDHDKASLLRRAQEYWALVRSGDNVAAWKYEEASKDPKATLEEYLKRGGVAYEALEVRDVRSVEGDRAIVNVWMRYSVPILRIRRQEAVAEDEWRRIDGVWHHVLRRSVMFSKDPK